MGVGALLPLAVGGLGSAIGSTLGTALLGESALAGGLATGINEAGMALGLPASAAVTQQGVAGGIGSLLGGTGASAAGSALAKAVAPPVGGVPPPTPGAVPMPSHKGIEAPQFQFQTVGPNPSAVIGARGGGDLTELLKRFAI